MIFRLLINPNSSYCQSIKEKLSEKYNVPVFALSIQNLNEENLFVKTCYVDEALVMKRAKMDSRGHVGRNDHKTSHITVIVAEK